MRFLDFSSWHGILSTLLGLALFVLIGVGARMLMMLTIQQRQQRMNRQINERLRTLIAAYKVLGGSFTGELLVSPAHLRDARQLHDDDADEADPPAPGSARARRIRDAVESALSDIILLGTEEHVRLASQAASDLSAGRPIHTAELVVSLRNFIRKALDLAPVPADVEIPRQGPARPQAAGARSPRADAGAGRAGGAAGGGAGGGGTGGMGMGLGMGVGRQLDDQ